MPAEKTPALDFAVPYAAPKLLKTMAATQPMALKNGCDRRLVQCHALDVHDGEYTAYTGLSRIGQLLVSQLLEGLTINPTTSWRLLKARG